LVALIDQAPARRAIATDVDDLPVVATGSGLAARSADPPLDFDEPPLPVRRGVTAIRWIWTFTRQHAAAVGVVLLGVCLWAGYTASQARSTEIETPSVTVAVDASPSPSAAPSASPSGSPEPPASPSPTPAIEIHVIGGVRKPGVVAVPQGSRLEDVIAAAGGLAANGDPAELNMAAVAVDGSQVVIGTKKNPRGEVRLDANGGNPAPTGTTASGAAQSVPLNSATAEQLETLPGVGPVTAGKILAWRAEHGHFSSIEELQEVSGIGPKTFAELKAYVRL